MPFFITREPLLPNVIIANLHEIYNFLSKQITFQIKKEILKKNYVNILILMSPIIPHFAQECLESLNIKKKINWPVAEEQYLKEDNVEIVIQINGKKRLSLKNKIDSSEKEIYDNLIKTEYFKKNYKTDEVKKIIYVKNRLLNLIIKK